jgi:hypothetical protein
MYKSTKNHRNYKKKSNKITLQELLNLIAQKTGYNPKLSGKNYMGLCPVHHDKRPSLSIREADNRTLLLRCFTGCPLEDICASMGISVSDLFPVK